MNLIDLPTHSAIVYRIGLIHLEEDEEGDISQIGRSRAARARRTRRDPWVDAASQPPTTTKQVPGETHRWLTSSRVPINSPHLALSTLTSPSLAPSMGKITLCGHFHVLKYVGVTWAAHEK